MATAFSNDVPLLFAIVTEFLVALCHKVSILFATVALDFANILSLRSLRKPSVSSGRVCNSIVLSFLLYQMGFCLNTLLFSQKFIQIDIQGW